jgi:hypothetical protein
VWPLRTAASALVLAFANLALIYHFSVMGCATFAVCTYQTVSTAAPHHRANNATTTTFCFPMETASTVTHHSLETIIMSLITTFALLAYIRALIPNAPTALLDTIPIFWAVPPVPPQYSSAKTVSVALSAYFVTMATISHQIVINVSNAILP